VLRVVAPEPPLHLSRLRLEFAAVMASLFKPYRLYLRSAAGAAAVARRFAQQRAGGLGASLLPAARSPTVSAQPPPPSGAPAEHGEPPLADEPVLNMPGGPAPGLESERSATWLLDDGLDELGELELGLRAGTPPPPQQGRTAVEDAATGLEEEEPAAADAPTRRGSRAGSFAWGVGTARGSFSEGGAPLDVGGTTALPSVLPSAMVSPDRLPEHVQRRLALHEAAVRAKAARYAAAAAQLGPPRARQGSRASFAEVVELAVAKAAEAGAGATSPELAPARVAAPHPAAASAPHAAGAPGPAAEPPRAPPFDAIFDAEGFLAEETPPDAEPLMAHVVKVSQSFSKFVEDRFADAPPPGTAASGGSAAARRDLFDALCFQRMALRAWRHLQLRGRPHSGQLYKAIRGTLAKSWERRLFSLDGGVLAYYAQADALESLANVVAALQMQLAGARQGGGRDGGSGSDSTSAAYQRLAAELEKAQQRLKALRASAYRRSFYMVPGRTEVVIPSTFAAAFPSPYLFQLVNPSLRELQARGVYVSDAPTAGEEPMRGGAGGSSGDSGWREKPQLTPQELAGAGRDVLTLCADTSEERRTWIMYLKSRLRTTDYTNQLKAMYR
jgi:hypothetical protein